jgi:hypothetical protein
MGRGVDEGRVPSLLTAAIEREVIQQKPLLR